MFEYLLKKSVLAGILLFLCIFFASLDWWINRASLSPTLPFAEETNSELENPFNPVFSNPIPEKLPETLELPQIAEAEKPYFENILSRSDLPVRLFSQEIPALIFEKIPTSALVFQKEIKKYQLNDNQKKPLWVYELRSEPLKGELLYAAIQKAAEALPSGEYSVNSTNKYGLQSFYLNETSQTNKAFLAILVDKNRVFLFEYDKAIHGLIEAIIALL